MKKIFPVATIAMIAITALGIPAKRVTRTVALSDGTSITITLTGDESNHYFRDENGKHYELSADGKYIELTVTQTNARAMRANSRVTASNNRRRANMQRHRNALTGEKRGLVILVNFKDKKMKCAQTDFNNAFNTTGYNENGSIGSVRDYFMAQSYNQLIIDFDVVGPVQLQKNMNYYGSNDSEGFDQHPAEMVIEAVKAVDNQVNFADYDWDKDGYVDQVYVIYAGYGEAQGAPAATIWPHEWDLNSAQEYNDGTGAQRLDGTIVNTYACSNELYGTSGSIIDGIGTACHEFSHCLGLPDMYDTSTSGSNYGMGYWDLMCSGSYNGDGYVPAGYSSYERMFAGWLDPIEIKEYTQVSALPALSENAEAYIIYNQANRNEYYLLENRQPMDWDSQLPAAGMLVLHVDYNEDIWHNNTVNNVSSRQRMTIIPADGERSEYNEEGDTWPQPNKTELTNTSSPAAKLYNKNSDDTMYMNIPIRNITQNSNGTIAFTAGESNTNTSIFPLNVKGSKTEIYNISGRRVQSKDMHQGIYILGNKKYGMIHNLY